MFKKGSYTIGKGTEIKRLAFKLKKNGITVLSVIPKNSDSIAIMAIERLNSGRYIIYHEYEDIISVMSYITGERAEMYHEYLGPDVSRYSKTANKIAERHGWAEGWRYRELHRKFR